MKTTVIEPVCQPIVTQGTGYETLQVSKAITKVLQFMLKSSTTVHNLLFYYMEESVLLGTKPLVDSIRHSIRDPSGVFSVCHAFECHIVQWRHDSRLFYFVEWTECVVASVLFRIMAVASRFVLLNDEQVKEFSESFGNENTKKKNLYDLKVFKEFLDTCDEKRIKMGNFRYFVSM